jgi:uncharacterized protein (DUF2384 family)
MSHKGDTSATGGAVPVLQQPGRQALEKADAQLGRIQESLEAAARAGALDRDVFDRAAMTFRDAAARVNQNLPSEIDAQAADELRARVINILTREIEDAASLDVADAFLVELEAIRHIIRDILQERPPIDVADASEVIAQLERWLPGATVAQLARLLGISSRQLQRLRTDSRPSSRRARLVLQLVAILRHAWTDQGVVAWFERERHEIGHKRPIDLLDDAGRERDLVNAARAGRAQGAA